MENRLEGQDIQGDELFIELTPEELKELEQVKGGILPLYPPGSFPLGIVIPEKGGLPLHPLDSFPLGIVIPKTGGLPLDPPGSFPLGIPSLIPNFDIEQT